MSFTSSQLFPGIENGLNSMGFLFGAGTSKEAGFPLMQDLTKTVVRELSDKDRNTLGGILGTERLNYDEDTGEPNIEILSDFVTQHLVTTQKSEFIELEEAIRKSIVKTIVEIEKPDLDQHVQFLEALRQRADGTSATVTVLTTNYDVLFELAAGEVTGVRIETGFEGLLRRLFNPKGFEMVRGKVKNRKFIEHPELRLNLLKLHGSVSWFQKEEGQVIESGSDLYDVAKERAVILPRRQKVMDTLSSPFDRIFASASQILGSSCKYLVSCGFSFSDQHINDHLIVPKLREGKIRLVALCGKEPECLNSLKTFPAFSAGFPDNCYIDRKDVGTGTDLWKFNRLVELLQP